MDSLELNVDKNGEKKFNVIFNMFQYFGFGDIDDDVLMFVTLLGSATDKTFLFIEFQERPDY